MTAEGAGLADGEPRPPRAFLEGFRHVAPGMAGREQEQWRGDHLPAASLRQPLERFADGRADDLEKPEFDRHAGNQRGHTAGDLVGFSGSQRVGRSVSDDQQSPQLARRTAARPLPAFRPAGIGGRQCHDGQPLRCQWEILCGNHD